MLQRKAARARRISRRGWEALETRALMAIDGVAACMATDVAAWQTASARAVAAEPAETLALQREVVLNEIHVDPEIRTEQVEFIELYNRGTAAVDLSGWVLRNAVDYTFPAGTVLNANAYLVVAENLAEFQQKFNRSAIGPWVGRLNNDGETIELWNASGDTIDQVDYQLGFPWPTYGDVGSPSIQLMNATLDNELGGSWRSSAPTPGRVNSIQVPNAPPQMRQVDHWPQQPIANQDVLITARITDPHGVGAVRLDYQLVNPGDYISLTNARYGTEWTSLVMVDDGTAGDAVAEDGTYTVTLPGSLQTHRRLVRYRITATDTLGASRTAPYEDDPQPNFAYYVYNGVPAWTGANRPGTTAPVTYSSELLNSIPVYQLITTRTAHIDSQFIPNSSRSSGYTGSDYLWEGTMVYDGVVYDHMNYRARGGVWRYAMGKNMWKFDFERGHSFATRDDRGNRRPIEWDKMNFSAIIQQGDYLHRGEQGLFESVGFRLFNLAGSEAPSTHYVHFRIVESADEVGANQYSGDFQGMYLAVEQPDGRYLDAHGLPDGNLYKIEGHAPESVNNQGPYQVSDGSDVRKFISSFRNAAKPTPDQWRQTLDLDDFYSYQTIAEAIHHYDTADGKNYFYYANPETGKFEMKVWDLDLTWADNMYGSAGHELNGDVAKNPAFNNYVNPANVTLNNRLNKEYQNRVRELRDLLYNSEQTGMLIDEQASFVYQPGQASFVDADRAMWDYNPIMAVASRYTNNSKNGVSQRFYNRATTKDYPGMIQIMKNYVVSRGSFMDRTLLTNEANIPTKPTIAYTGEASYPVNQLEFSTSAFASPVQASFAAMQWRIAEVTDPNAPGYNRFDRTLERKYEIDDLWTSDELTTFQDRIKIPGEKLEPGKTYRVRVRMKDNDGHWSHWSGPAQFVSGPASARELTENLRVSEIHYNPADPTAAERTAGFTDNDDFEFLELTNIGNATLDLRGVTLNTVETPTGSQGVSFAFDGAGITQLAPGQQVLIVENLEAFRHRYGDGLPVAGAWDGRLDNAGEMLTLSAYGTIIQQFTYSDIWYPTTDGLGPALESVDPRATDLGAWGTAFGWKASQSDGGTPGTLPPTGDIPGDANRDQIFNSTDLILVFQAGEYEDGIALNSTWEEGDWDGDQDFTTGDLVYAFQLANYSVAARKESALDQLWAEWR